MWFCKKDDAYCWSVTVQATMSAKCISLKRKRTNDKQRRKSAPRRDFCRIKQKWL